MLDRRGDGQWAPRGAVLAFAACAGLVWLVRASPVPAAGSETLAATPPADADYTGGGIEACVACHDETERYPVLSIFKTKHAVQADARTPLAASDACEVCHGPSAAHEEDDRIAPAQAFGPEHPPAEQNAVCLACHRGGQLNWLGSTHESEQLACVSCHRIHVEEDPVRSSGSARPDVWIRDGQAEICFGCHPQQRAQSHRISSHPIKEGKAACSGCHDPHGSMGPSMLVGATVNQTCYACHAEKRGPFLWEHAPVREDCGLCHDPHGSNHQPLLRARGPWLCQRCHMASFHPSTAYGGGGVPPAGADDHLVARECRNCHDEVHGSNHPSGVRWTR